MSVFADHPLKIDTCSERNAVDSMGIEKSNKYEVRFKRGFREMAWVEYEDAGRTLSLYAEWTGGRQRKTELVISLSEKVYFPPDSENPLSEGRILEIQKRISESLEKMDIPHAFIRHGWTSLS